jgi:hypothetical protein
LKRYDFSCQNVPPEIPPVNVPVPDEITLPPTVKALRIVTPEVVKIRPPEPFTVKPNCPTPGRYKPVDVLAEKFKDGEVILPAVKDAEVIEVTVEVFALYTLVPSQISNAVLFAGTT